MTLKQKIVHFLYPWILRLTKIVRRKKAMPASNMNGVIPPKSLYDLSIELNNGSPLALKSYQGKKLLLVNTASNCGYTPQYAELQEIYESFKGKVEVIGFPANDFKEQEKGNDAVIAAFCKSNYGVTFPLAKKDQVVKGAAQQAVFQWLTNKGLNGWNDQPPGWNFYKYLIDEQGTLMAVFPSNISPKAIELK